MSRSLPARVGIEVSVIPVICKCSVVPNLLSYRFGKLSVSHALDNLRNNILIVSLEAVTVFFLFFANFKHKIIAIIIIGSQKNRSTR